MDKLMKTLVIVGIVLLGFTFGCIYSVSVATEITQTNPTNPKASIDCLLIQYSDNGQDGLRISSYWLKDKGCKRTVVYPEGYVPVLIRQEDVDKVRTLVGKDCFVRISPNLE